MSKYRNEWKRTKKCAVNAIATSLSLPTGTIEWLREKPRRKKAFFLFSITLFSFSVGCFVLEYGVKMPAIVNRHVEMKLKRQINKEN